MNIEHSCHPFFFLPSGRLDILRLIRYNTSRIKLFSAAGSGKFNEEVGMRNSPLQIPSVMVKCDMDNNEQRIEAAEIKLSYIEDFVNQLQQAVLEQKAELDALRRENKALAAKLGDIASLLDDDIPNRRPPHY